MAVAQQIFNRINQLGPEGGLVAESLLKAYPMTRALLQALGGKLVAAMEYAVAAPGMEIIRQGDEGKDLYLLCEGAVEVLVNNQKVVELKAPALLGDKGIVQLDSKRAATIRVAQSRSLFIKIPMDSFLHGLNQESVADAAYEQDARIYAALFAAIQDRLYQYMSHQKSLWEEVNSTLERLNIKLLAKSLEGGKKLNWSSADWAKLAQAIKEVTGFAWPPKATLDSGSFSQLMPLVLAKKTEPLKSRMKANQLAAKRRQMWLGWLEKLSKKMVPLLGKEKLPINLGEIELFNPKLYSIKIQTLIKAFEKPLVFPEGKEEAHQLNQFFHRGERANFLDLDAYLESLARLYRQPDQNRTLARISQRVAMVSAKSENDFNTSIVRMQTFLEKVRSMALDLGEQEKVVKLDHARLHREQQILVKSYDAFLRSKEITVTSKRVGEASFNHAETPRLADLIQASGSASYRQAMEQSFHKLSQMLGLGEGNQSALLARHAYVLKTSPGFKVGFAELDKGYWIPISPGITLMAGGKVLCDMEPGRLIGGRTLASQDQPSLDKAELYLQIPPRQEKDSLDHSYAFFVLPFSLFPWQQVSFFARPKVEAQDLNLMNWLVSVHVKELSRLAKGRDELFLKWSKIEKLVRLEKEIKLFETKAYPTTKEMRLKLADYLLNRLGMKLPTPEMLNSALLSKKLYNQMLRLIKSEQPALTVEELGNKAYTRYRLVISELVQMLLALAPQPEGNHGPETLAAEALGEGFRRLLEEQGLAEFEGAFQADDQGFNFYLTGLLEQLSHDPEAFGRFVMEFNLLLEQHHFNLFQETQDLEERLAQISNIRSNMDLDSMQSEVIRQCVQSLKSLLQQARQKAV